MKIYIFILIFITFMSYLSVKCGHVFYDKDSKENRKIGGMLFISIITLTIVGLYAFRWKVGTDFSGYLRGYYQYGKESIVELIGERDWGFSVISLLIYKIWPDNFIFYNFILGILTYLPVIMTFRKYSTNFPLTIYLYIAGMTCFWPFNGVRQSIACSICFAAFPLLYEKKYVKYLSCIFMAYLFHSTALIMIPLMFVVTRKAWSKIIWIFTGGVLMSVVFLQSAWVYIVDFLDYIGQEKMASDYAQFDVSDDGVNILRILVALIPVIISLVCYKRMTVNKKPITEMFINMNLVYAIFMIAAGRVTILARFSSYFSFFVALLIPEFVKIFECRTKKIFILGVMGCFLVYMILLLPHESHLVPYSFVFDR